MSEPKSNWIAAAEMGLISSSFSTIVSQLSAARLGRDALVDWMTVAAIPIRDSGLSAEPTSGAVLAGIAFHQWADFSWAMMFFGLLGRWTAALSPLQILALAIPWAVLMSIHHAGAVKMADQEWHGHGDPRLRVMAHAIRHEQQGEIALMHGATGIAAVITATRNMLADNVN